MASICKAPHGRLAAVRLIARRGSSLLGEFLDHYLARRTDVKPNTQISYKGARRRLIAFFGADKPLRDVTRADADDFLIHLRDKYAGGAAGRTFGMAQQFFRSAVRGRLIAENPFSDVKLPSQVNPAKQFYITPEMAQRVLAACPNAEWRLIFALSRYGGLRCPSEHLGLTWGDVDWARERFLVHSPKTEHHEGKAERWVPIFPELRPHLEAVFEQAEPGTVRVITCKENSQQNLRTRLTKIIKRAGLTPWPKLFHNLRASCETDLARDFAMHLVCAWIGNTQLIAAKHYLQVTEADFKRAAKSDAFAGKAVQKAVQQAAASDGTNAQESPQVGTVASVREPVRFDASCCGASLWAMRESNPRLHGVSMA
jgi:integrase